MSRYYLFHCIILCTHFVASTHCFKLINWIKDKLDIEHCGSEWIEPDFIELERDLRETVYGQHLIYELVPRLIRGHYDHSPQTALAISFHGTTGVGKNYVSRKIATHLYKRGFKSKFVKQFIATVDFTNPHDGELYKRQLQEEIRRKVSACSRSLFIFDEVEKMPTGVLDAITPFLDYNVHVQGVDYRKAIFIFLSNTGGAKITQKALEHWRSGQQRESLQLKDVENLLMKAVFNEPGGLLRSSLIDRKVISAFIPFLPLERQHVKRCIADDAASKGRRLQDAELNAIADELEYYPDDLQLYSTSGCKRVSEKVHLFLYSRPPRTDL